MTMLDAATPDIAHESGGHVKGVALALVTQNHDPDGLCRVRVRYLWHDAGRESHWARLAVPMAGQGRGWVSIPEVGDEVLVAFEREDLRHPYVLGALWNGVDTPPERNSEGRNDKRVFVSRKGHRLSFDDGKRGVVELALDDGRVLRLDDDGIRLDDGHGNRLAIDSRAGTVSIEAARSLSIKAPAISIEAKTSLTVHATGELKLGGSYVRIN